MRTFNLPDLGEGLPEAEIVKWRVQIGDFLKMDEPMVDVENAKAVMEIPAPYSGKVVKIYGNAGDIIETGSPLIDIEVEGQEEKPSSEEKKATDAGTVVGNVKVSDEVKNEEAVSFGKGGAGFKVTPAVRALARKKKIDLATIIPTGPMGTITKEDVENAGTSKPSLPGSLSLKGARRVMAQQMAISAAEVAPATVTEEADITGWHEQDTTWRLVKAVVDACKSEPALNAWYDAKNIAQQLHESVHLGLAMDTPKGLFVPVIKGAEELDQAGVRAVIESFKSKVKGHGFSGDDIRGATITLSNVGTIGGIFSTPVVTPPQVAILACGRLVKRLCKEGSEIVEKSYLPLSLTFDHRAATGGEAARFLMAVKASLESV